MFKKLAAILLMISVAAAEDSICNPAPCCNPPPPCCWNFNPCNPKGCADMNCGGFYMTADFLYWRAENHGFSYGYELTTILSNAAAVADNQNFGKIIRMSPEWDRGFRFSLGWNSRYDFWDLLLNYTCYNNQAKEKITSTTGFFPLWLENVNDRFGSASASTFFHLNMCDFEIGRLTALTKTISFRPHWGLRGGTLYQTFKDHFYDNLRTPPLPENSEVRFDGSNNYWGAGVRAGVDGHLQFSRGFGFLGKLAGALLYGKNKASSVSKHVVANIAPVETTNASCDDNYYQLAPTLQLALGIQWQTCFWCEKLFYKMAILWETNYWWNQFNLPVQVQSASLMVAPLPALGNQPLTMEGITMNFELDF